jgi:hypothetical protein
MRRRKGSGQRYVYEHPDHPEWIAMWQRRCEHVDGRPSQMAIKMITYMQPAQLGDNDTYRGIDGKPTKALADRCLYRLPLLRQAIEAGAPAAFWCEGEKDTQAAEELC